MLKFFSIFSITLLNIIILFNFSKIAKFLNINDIPNESRKIHSHPVPTIGGVIILLNLILILILSLYQKEILLIFEGERSLSSLLIVGTLITCFGAYDDKFGISPTNKLLILGLLIYLALLLDNTLIINYLNFGNYYYFNIERFGIFFTIVCFIIFLNAFNMFDGINGQSGCYSLVILTFLYLKNPNIFIILISISIIFFLYLNFKNKIFLGDNGSYLISFLLSCLIIKNYNLTLINFTVEEILLLMIYPGIDLLRLFISRLSKGKHPFFPDSNHIHHIIYNKTKSQLIALFMNLVGIIFPILLYLFFENIYLSLILSLSMYLIFYKIFNKKVNA